MAQYIDKDVLVAEINNWIKDAKRKYTLSKVQFSLSDRIESLENLLSFLDTLEVKGVDLEKEIDKFEKEFNKYCRYISEIDIQEAPFAEMHDCARHFFELGLAQKGE